MEVIHSQPTTPNHPLHERFHTHRSDKNQNAALISAIRVALVKDRRLYNFLLANVGTLRRRQPSALQDLARRCMQRQEIDFDEERAGEALGLATAARLERIVPNIRRDAAATYGIVVEVAYAYLAGMLSVTDLERAISLVDALGFSLYTAELFALSSDAARRARRDRGLSLLLIKGIGQGAERQMADPSLLEHAVRLLETWSGDARRQWAVAVNEA